MLFYRTCTVTLVLAESPVVGLLTVTLIGKLPLITGAARVPPHPTTPSSNTRPASTTARRKRDALLFFRPSARPAKPSTGKNAAYRGGVFPVPSGINEAEPGVAVTLIVTVVVSWLVDPGLKLILTPGGTLPVKDMTIVPSPADESTVKSMEAVPP